MKCLAYLFIANAISLLEANAFITRSIFQCCVSEISLDSIEKCLTPQKLMDNIRSAFMVISNYINKVDEDDFEFESVHGFQCDRIKVS